MLILVAHGSHNPEWRASVESVVDDVAADCGPGSVMLAYMDCTPPTVMDVAAAAIAAGAHRIRVLPLFLAAQGHVDRDVAPLVNAVREAFPEVAVEMLAPMGQLAAFGTMLRAVAREE